MIKPTSWVNGVNEGASRPVHEDNLRGPCVKFNR